MFTDLSRPSAAGTEGKMIFAASIPASGDQENRQENRRDVRYWSRLGKNKEEGD